MVGPKGQVVIAMGIRDSLGIAPGWVSLQRLVDDHVEIHFLPPEHRESLKGALAPYVKTHVPPGDEWRDARERAWKTVPSEHGQSAGHDRRVQLVAAAMAAALRVTLDTA